MGNSDNRYPWWLLIGAPVLLIAVGAVIGRTILRPHQEPPEPVYLPSEAVTVEVESQTTLDELAAAYSDANDLRMIEGQLRDEIGRLVNVVSVLSVDTGPVEPPEPEIIERIIYEACAQQENIIGRASLEAFQFRGLDSDGNLAYGWRGTIQCEIAQESDRKWAVLVKREFDPLVVSAVTSQPPELLRQPQRWFLSMDYAVLRDTTSAQFDSFVSSFRPDALRIRGGYRLWPLKRRTVEMGVFADSQSAGLSLGLAW